MIKKTNVDFILVILFAILPSFLFAQSESDPIETPPAAPIDDNIIYLFVGALILALYYFYLKNLIIEEK